jgi:hypothetical protein
MSSSTDPLSTSGSIDPLSTSGHSRYINGEVMPPDGTINDPQVIVFDPERPFRHFPFTIEYLQDIPIGKYAWDTIQITLPTNKVDADDWKAEIPQKGKYFGGHFDGQLVLVEVSVSAFHQARNWYNHENPPRSAAAKMRRENANITQGQESFFFLVVIKQHRLNNHIFSDSKKVEKRVHPMEVRGVTTVGVTWEIAVEGTEKEFIEDPSMTNDNSTRFCSIL